MLADLVVASESEDWKAGSNAAICAQCGKELVGNGTKKRKLQTRGGREVGIEQEYGICPKCGQGFFPLDEELDLLPGMVSPYGHECLVRLARWKPFEKEAELLEDLIGIHVSKSISETYSEAAGADYVEL